MGPRELIELADRQGLAGVALTDHDTIAGLDEAADAAVGMVELTFMPGIELSAVSHKGTLHILGYGFEPAHPAMTDLTRQLRESRDNRNPRMIIRMRELGVDISMADVLAEAGVDQALNADDPAYRPPRVISRIHMANVLCKKKYAKNVSDAFTRYLGPDAPAFVDKEQLAPAEAIAAVHEAGGLAFVAHPVHLEFQNFSEAERMIRQLVAAGADGVEVYHSDHNDLQTRFFLDLTKQLNLLPCGGSDFHGQAKQHVQLGRPPVPASVLHNLLNALGNRPGQ